MKLEFCYKDPFIKLLSYPEGDVWRAGAMPGLALHRGGGCRAHDEEPGGSIVFRRWRKRTTLPTTWPAHGLIRSRRTHNVASSAPPGHGRCNKPDCKVRFPGESSERGSLYDRIVYAGRDAVASCSFDGAAKIGMRLV